MLSLCIWFSALLLLGFLTCIVGQNLESIAKEIGSTFCMYLAFKYQIPRKYFNECGQPSCSWDDWQDALTEKVKPKKERYVVSYGHNGFGNQLWEHSTAFMIAEALKARLLIAVIPDELSPNGFIPPNTWQGMQAMERLLPKEFLYEQLPDDSPIRNLCDKEDFFVADRPVDFRNKNYTDNFKKNIYNLITDEQPRCIKLVGYFQNLPLCREGMRKLWTERLFANITERPGENDISIYLRCVPRHYHFNGKHFYENILNNTDFENVWLFQAPECPNNLNPDPAQDGMVAAVVRLLKEEYGAKKWPEYKGEDDGTMSLLHDLAGLALSKKLVLPVSSWAFWAGMLSNATEIHVNAPPHHQVMYGMDRYTYHNERTNEYYGKLTPKGDDIVYAINEHTVRKRRKRERPRVAAVSAVTPAAAATAVVTSTADTSSTSMASGNLSKEKIHDRYQHHIFHHKHRRSSHVSHTNYTRAPGTNSSSMGEVYIDGKLIGGRIAAVETSRLPIVYVFTVVPAICERGLPEYIQHSLEQGLFTQPDCDVILVSNFADCASTARSVSHLKSLILVDSTQLTSLRTEQFKNASAGMFQTDGKGELWLTSALRFFLMEDLMEAYGYTELVHVETDNMLYGRYTALLPTLRSSYHGLAATPLNAEKSFITASVFWIAKLSYLTKFNNYLLHLGSNKNNMWSRYLKWMRIYACCKPGGIDPDKDGNGIKPFAVNEMSMLAFYHEIRPEEFKIFPVVPAHEYMLNRYVINMSTFGPHGPQVGPPTGHGVWDPNSWGQYIGGTASKGGRDKRFTDASHVVGQAIRLNPSCELQMRCGNQTVAPYVFTPKGGTPGMTQANSHSTNSSNSDSKGDGGSSSGGGSSVIGSSDSHHTGNSSSGSNAGTVIHTAHGELLTPMERLELLWWEEHQETFCYTAPFVRCSEDEPWTPLWNLHVHSKHTQDYKSERCECPTAPSPTAESATATAVAAVGGGGASQERHRLLLQPLVHDEFMQMAQ